MNSKNLKKALNAKLTDWLKSVDDSEIKKEIKENVIITGGAIVSLLTGDKVNDYDVYFRTKESLVKVAEYYVKKWNDGKHKRSAELRVNEAGQVKCFISSAGMASEEDEKEKEEPTPFEEFEPEESESDTPEADKYRPVFLTSNAITLSDKIQVVTRFYGEVEEIHKNYDFAHCTCAWSSWDNNLSLPQKALECIINKELYYIGSKYPLCSIIRTRKYINRGYTINAGQYLKMCLQLNDIDLRNIEVLEDQLVGVDSAYFETAIEVIENKKNNDPTFEPDNDYLFEVINRIF
ncbi:MAG TPA: hypothetical protein DEQ64_14525 [Lachnoclostridium sp.]|uniref:hypothetical protein n=1 Tax=Lacrimispora sp. TaxID=2719234 RepID=UPI000EBC8D05|nr:hypothetical protein [Lacrimispora sp.]HCD44915.1 hypothetical protein [Lachnoclostridium sp.]